MSRRIELYFPTKENNTYEIIYEGRIFCNNNKQKCMSAAMKCIRQDIMRSLGTRKELKKLGYFN